MADLTIEYPPRPSEAAHVGRVRRNDLTIEDSLSSSLVHIVWPHSVPSEISDA